MARLPDPYLIDDENPELTDEQLKNMRPFKEVFPEFAAAMRKQQNERKLESKLEKLPVYLELDADLLDFLQNSGFGWQLKVNDILRQNLMKA